METTLVGVWRSTPKPAAATPFPARSAGHAILPAGWSHGTGTIHHVNLYWGTSGSGGPCVNGLKTVVPKDHIALHYPGDRISGYPIAQPWNYRWLTFDGPNPRAMAEMFGLKPPWPRRVGRCPEVLFDKLERELKDVSTTGEYRASVTLYEILALAARGETASAPDGTAALVERCLRRIEERLADPELSVDSLAREFDLHRSRLSRMFRAQTGLSPVEYIQRLRLNQALSMLRQSGRTIRQIAFATGFTDPAYFSRWIAAKTGFGPRRLRSSMLG